MAAIYSTRFIGQQVTTSTPVIYTVPSGNVAVLRSISMTPAATGLTAAEVSLGSASIVWKVATGTLSVTQTWDGRQVFNAGETIECTCAGANAYFMCSGYLLTP